MKTVGCGRSRSRTLQALAKAKRTGASRVIQELVESGLAAREQERQRFLALADRLTRSTTPDEQRELKATLARLTFGH